MGNHDSYSDPCQPSGRTTHPLGEKTTVLRIALAVPPKEHNLELARPNPLRPKNPDAQVDIGQYTG